MILTNILNLPQAVVNAVANDPYSKGDADFSVTELIAPARMRALRKRHWHELSEDVSDRLWAMYGQLAHVILERAAMATDLTEKRYFADYGGTRVSGQIDTLAIADGALTDYKFTTAWGFKSNTPPKPEWIAQLNMQRHILMKNGISSSKLQIIGFLRDWQIRDARANPDYPQKPIAKLNIPVWSDAMTEAFILERIKIHQDASIMLPECTPSERWAKDDVYAVMKKGLKRAVSLQYSLPAAEKIATAEGGYVTFRPGESARCASYCAVSDYCEQYQLTKGKP